MTATKIDYKKELKQFYKPKVKPEIIELPAIQYLMIDGEGGLAGELFQQAIEALFAVSYKTKFISKKELGQDYAVMPLEGLWWAHNMNDFESGNKDKWKWTLMIMQPWHITTEVIEQAMVEVKKKKNLQAIDQLRLEPFSEGKCAQMMHIGPFSEEHENIMKLHNLIEEQGGAFDGKIQKHHEIYLSDFRKIDPAKMKTVIRQPFV